MSDSKKARTFEMEGLVFVDDKLDPIGININDVSIRLVGITNQLIDLSHDDFDRICDEVDAYRRAVRAANGVSDE